MKGYVSAVLLGLIVAAIWGYFADLRNGQVEWFIGRLIFVPLVMVVVQRLLSEKASAERKESA